MKKKELFPTAKHIPVLVAFSVLVISLMIVVAYEGHNQASLSFEQQKLLKKLVVEDIGEDTGFALVIGEKINLQRLEMLASMDYDVAKSRLGLKKDFAIYFLDENNTSVPIGDKPCIGSPKAVIAGRSCG